MARYTKIPLKRLQKVGLASPSESIRRRGQKRPRLSSFGERLEQKQKLKYIYGVMERQMKRYVREAFNSRQDPQMELLIKLESRLDNVVYRLGFGKTRSHARQLVNHGHILVNDKKVDIPSYILKPGERVSLQAKTWNKEKFREQIEHNRGILSSVSYLEYEPNAGRFVSIPIKEDLALDVDISKVMEFYHNLS